MQRFALSCGEMGVFGIAHGCVNSEMASEILKVNQTLCDLFSFVSLHSKLSWLTFLLLLFLSSTADLGQMRILKQGSWGKRIKYRNARLPSCRWFLVIMEKVSPRKWLYSTPSVQTTWRKLISLTSSHVNIRLRAALVMFDLKRCHAVVVPIQCLKLLLLVAAQVALYRFKYWL